MSDSMIRRTPRSHETISISGRTKWRLDALAVIGRRSRSATVEILLEEYLRARPQLAAAMEERSRDPHPIQLKRFRRPDPDPIMGEVENG